VGRVWPRHGGGGRPLNGIVRRHDALCPGDQQTSTIARAHFHQSRVLTRRSFFASTIACVVLGVRDLLAQSSAQVYRVAVIGRNALSKPWPEMVGADPIHGEWWDYTEYRRALSRRGFEVGRNLEMRGYLPRSTAKNDIETSIRQAIAWHPHVLKVFSVADTLLARSITGSIPIVFSRVDDPVTSGLVASLSRPGDNVTGVYGNSENLVLKCLEIALALLQKHRRVAVVFDSRSYPGTLAGLARLRSAAAEARITLVEADISRYPNSIEGALEDIAARNVDAAIEFGFLQTHVPPGAYRRFQERSRAPYIADSEGAVRLGAIAGMEADQLEQIDSAAGLTARILTGMSPALLPVTAATRYRLAINRIEARKIGLVLPDSLLLRADRVIE